MPKRSYRSRSSQRSAPRRKTTWIGQTYDPATLAPGGQSFIDCGGDQLEDNTETPIGRAGLTRLRIIATLRINSTDANLSAEMTFGFIMTDGDAFVASALPDPFTDPDAPWMHWDRRTVLPPSDSGQHLALDIRAKRVYRGGNDPTVALILQNDDAAQTIEFSFGFRMLLGLP